MIWSETRGEIAKALSKAQLLIVGAVKDSENPHFKSDYSSLSSVWDAAHGPLNSNGIAIVQSVQSLADGKHMLVTALIHESGEWLQSQCTISPVQNTPQGFGSALTYARRQSLAAMTGVAPMDDDGNDASAKAAIPQEAKRGAVPRLPAEPPGMRPGSLKSEGLPEAIPDTVTTIPAPFLLANKPIGSFEGIALQIMTPDDLDLVIETLKRFYEERTKSGKLSHHGLAWCRAIISTAVSLQVRAKVGSAMDKFSDKQEAPK